MLYLHTGDHLDVVHSSGEDEEVKSESDEYRVESGTSEDGYSDVQTGAASKYYTIYTMLL